ncbi:MAG: hypothetical protein MZV64_73770 [Ignavibacteriales bacterium]|nr:hypothetical protein [Ignavibacteriales bacterium]
MISATFRVWRVPARGCGAVFLRRRTSKTPEFPSSRPGALRCRPHAAFLSSQPLTVSTPPPMPICTAGIRSSTWRHPSHKCEPGDADSPRASTTRLASRPGPRRADVT